MWEVCTIDAISCRYPSYPWYLFTLCFLQPSSSCLLNNLLAIPWLAVEPSSPVSIWEFLAARSHPFSNALAVEVAPQKWSPWNGTKGALMWATQNVCYDMLCYDMLCYACMHACMYLMFVNAFHCVDSYWDSHHLMFRRLHLCFWLESEICNYIYICIYRNHPPQSKSRYLMETTRNRQPWRHMKLRRKWF